jgi:hypothetical protein
MILASFWFAAWKKTYAYAVFLQITKRLILEQSQKSWHDQYACHEKKKAELL